MMTALDIFAALPQERKEEITEQFWSKVRKGGVDECWEWTAGKHSNGYGQFTIYNKGKYFKLPPHRFSYFLSGKGFPHDLFVLHKCDNRACCNPIHLFIGTQMDNIHDMIKKGRHGHGDLHWSCLYPGKSPRGRSHYSHLHPEKMARGETCGSAKLTELQVLEILALYTAGSLSQAELGRKFGLTRSNISLIINNKIWKHVEYQTPDVEVYPKTPPADYRRWNIEE